MSCANLVQTCHNDFLKHSKAYHHEIQVLERHLSPFFLFSKPGHFILNMVKNQKGCMRTTFSTLSTRVGVEKNKSIIAIFAERSSSKFWRGHAPKFWGEMHLPTLTPRAQRWLPCPLSKSDYPVAWHEVKFSDWHNGCLVLPPIY